MHVGIVIMTHKQQQTARLTGDACSKLINFIPCRSWQAGWVSDKKPNKKPA